MFKVDYLMLVRAKFSGRARLQISSHILEIFDETSMASQHQLKPTTALTDLSNFDQKKESALGVEFGGGKLPFCDARFTHSTMSVKISRVISKRRCFAALVTAGFSRPNYQNRMMIGGVRVFPVSTKNTKEGPASQF